ncbi:DMT family transporter [Aurantibacillus circumpalustris]|uniref:DMT family transporter n=1 Tax=Aurantibacillus circumpalustris TaxID=3036359 RepID=UPI00295B31D1|nr:EamA family transporter [Aurantibacillus circumpalustris]
MTKAFKGHIALFVAQIIYALNYSIAKGLMPNFVSPVALVFMRILGAGLLFWVLSLFVKTQKVEKKDMKRMALLALFGVVINQLFFIYGLSITTPINSSIIMISNPILVFIFTLFLLKERITLIKLSGLSLAVIGALIILSYRGNFEIGSDTIVGDIMTLINSTSWAIFTVMVKPIMMKYNTATAMRWMFLFGSLYILPIGFTETLHTNWEGFTSHAIFALCFVVIATTFFAYFLNIYGLQELSPNTVSAYIYLQPFFASLFAVMMGQDKLSPTKLLSGILIILGLFLINRKPKKIKA